MAKKAAFLGEIYNEGGTGQGLEHSTLRELLRDDAFKRNRRRRLPEPYAEGQTLFLFDADLFVFDAEKDGQCDCEAPGGTVLLSFVANFGDQGKNGGQGQLQAIPWSIVADAVRMNA